MSDTDIDHEFTGGPDDLLAAEFVLGCLPVGQQADIFRRVEQDAEFARLVAEWEERLSPMADGFFPVKPPPKVKHELDRRLFGQAPVRSSIWSSLMLWRGIACVTTIAFLFVLTLPTYNITSPDNRLAASLNAEGSDVTYVVLYDADSGSVSLAHVKGEPLEGRDFQLWIARGTEAPVSLGVIPAGASVQVELSDQIRELMTTASHMAISLEPSGGSPTGLPTGPVLAVGNLLEI